MVALICAFAVSAVAFVIPGSGLAASTPVCSTANLRLDKIGENDFTSHRGWNFALRNVGSRTCHLKGFPAVRLLDANAQPMPTRMGHFGGRPHTVVLAPFHRGFFSVTFAVSGPCSKAVFANGMAIVPPKASPRLVWYAGRFDLCGPAPALVNISPVAFPRQF
ncbi:MAG TPA: DUF4232 domain-containing protein [Solirubrobacteraceae bacterium]|nr:DUF4232 domain-containing protein [Solirubrobacteraceae bacterium]